MEIAPINITAAGGTQKFREGEFKIPFKYHSYIDDFYNFSNLNGKLLKKDDETDQAMHWGPAIALKSAKMLIRAKN